MNYRVKKLQSKPVDTQFMIDNEKQILITEAKGVEVTKRGKKQ